MSKKHKEHFADMLPLLQELKQLEDIYRNSTIDITHNHVRLLYSKNCGQPCFPVAELD